MFSRLLHAIVFGIVLSAASVFPAQASHPTVWILVETTTGDTFTYMEATSYEYGGPSYAGSFAPTTSNYATTSAPPPNGMEFLRGNIRVYINGTAGGYYCYVRALSYGEWKVTYNVNPYNGQKYCSYARSGYSPPPYIH
jgi:hypothetical protein